MVRMLVERAEEGARRATRLLANIEDRGALPALREAARHPLADVRAAAIVSLGWSGGAEDVPDVIAALSDPEPPVRRSARAALAELGGREAADALARSLREVNEEERVQVIQALAWLRDPRALDPARVLASTALYDSAPGRRGWRNSVWAAVRLGDSADRRTLVDRVVELAQLVEDPDPRLNSIELRRARDAYANVALALRLEHPDEVEEAREALWEGAPAQAAAVTGRRRAVPAPPIAVREPLGARSVPRMALAALSDAPPDDRFPPAKFGGQPDWVGEPTWPLADGGRPLVFFAQLPLVGEIARTAYVFVSADENAATFAPLSDGNAVVVQPGGAPHLASAPMSHGPALFEGIQDTERLAPLQKEHRYERYITLEDGADPAEWTWPEPPEGEMMSDRHGDWNKIGGTPLFLQDRKTPPGDGWRFAFQFSADWAGRELGDGAECYGFVRDDGTGAFLWQCH
jgi:HEAT repeats